MMKPLSNCCKAPMLVSDQDEGTKYYFCVACNKPCNPFVAPARPRLAVTLWKQQTGPEFIVFKISRERYADGNLYHVAALGCGIAFFFPKKI